jgi:deoxyribonuclease (pyrimidine dimer)
MVRINLINPKYLADQHLIAEYDEILMLLGYVKKYPKIIPGTIPERYCLGKGHIKFFKNKLLYIKKRHEYLKQEMRKRGFATNITIELSKYPKALHKNWKPDYSDAEIIKERITAKLLKKKDYYRYYGKPKSQKYLIGLIEKAKI